MAGNVEIRAVSHFPEVVRRLRQTGRGDLVRGMTKDLRQVARQLGQRGKAEVVAEAPSAGGMQRVAQRAPLRIEVRTGGARGSGIRVTYGKNKSGVRALDTGVLRHPVFGRQVFVNQPVPRSRGDWTRTVIAGRGDVERTMLRVMNGYADRLARGL